MRTYAYDRLITPQTKPPSPEGFTLIELIIVIAMISILAALAIPSYQSYMIRTKVSEGLILSANLKNHVSEYYLLHSRFPENNAEMGFSPEGTEFSGKYVAQITTEGHDNELLLRITFNQGKHTPTEMQNKSFIMLAEHLGENKPLIWRCQADTDETGLISSFLPAECR
jgi:type IV pilus assembly protein PilA